MAVEVQMMAHLVCDLLECSAVYLLLDCAESALCHPLLELAVRHGRLPHLSYYASGRGSLLPTQSIKALCDIALQAGPIYCANDITLRGWRGSVIVVPLERPQGMLGFIVCIQNAPEAFLTGERHLLKRYTSVLARHLECMLCDSSTLPAHTTQRHMPLAVTEAWEQCTASREHVRAVTSDAIDKDVMTGVEEQSAFISLVSHELRRPLAAIKGYAGLLQAYGVPDGRDPGFSSVLTPALQRQYVDTIMEQTNYLEILIDDLLDMSRIQAGRLALRRTHVDMAQLCQHVARLMQQRVDQQQPGRYHIRCNLARDLPFVWADAVRVQQVLMNLLENAVKYSPGGGVIEILAYARCASVSIHERVDAAHGEQHTTTKLYITIRDWGIGIPRQQQSSLFKLFSRLEHPATHHVPGYGLGLYISYKLVDAMDGSVTLYSNENEGTSITFTLPGVGSPLVPCDDGRVHIPSR